MEELLECDRLKTYFKVPRGTVRAVDDVSLSLAPGETIGLVGESGCGKSTLGKTIARLIRPSEGTILFRGTDITRLSRWELQPFRRKIQFVFQDPFAALNPRSRVRRILEEPLIVHRMGSRRERLEKISWLMERVGIPIESMSNYPHEFSGGPAPADLHCQGLGSLPGVAHLRRTGERPGRFRAGAGAQPPGGSAARNGVFLHFRDP